MCVQDLKHKVKKLILKRANGRKCKDVHLVHSYNDNVIRKALGEAQVLHAVCCDSAACRDGGLSGLRT